MLCIRNRLHLLFSLEQSQGTEPPLPWALSRKLCLNWVNTDMFLLAWEISMLFTYCQLSSSHTCWETISVSVTYISRYHNYLVKKKKRELWIVGISLQKYITPRCARLLLQTSLYGNNSDCIQTAQANWSLLYVVITHAAIQTSSILLW